MRKTDLDWEFACGGPGRKGAELGFAGEVGGGGE